jgi:CheY-like chemotaxis protein
MALEVHAIPQAIPPNLLTSLGFHPRRNQNGVFLNDRDHQAFGRMSAATMAGVEDEFAPGRGTILMVEDEPGVREAIAMLLEMIGYAVISAGSGEEALALPLESVPDLLLSDVKLPGMPGTVAAAQLVARWPLLKVVLMSGYFDDGDLLGMAAERGWGFLQKPFEITDLADKLEASLHGNREVAETIS